MYNFTVPMALVDFIPVLLFGAAAILLLRDLKMGKAAYALFAAGVIDIFCAGFPIKHRVDCQEVVFSPRRREAFNGALQGVRVAFCYGFRA